MYIVVMILVSTLGGLAFLLSSYLGVFRPVEIENVTIPKLHLLYAEHIGPYHKIVEKIEAVESWAKANQVPCVETFGHFLDDPELGEDLRLRAHAGCVLESELNTEPPAEFQTKILPEQPGGVRVIFSGSPGIGPMKVYPKVDDWFADLNKTRKRNDTLELYRIHDDNQMTTTYYFKAQ